MRLSDESHTRVEQFFRAHRGDAGLVLPRMRVHVGAFARLLMMLALGMSGITFGPHVFVRPALLRKDRAGHLTLPGWLVVEEELEARRAEDAYVAQAPAWHLPRP